MKNIFKKIIIFILTFEAKLVLWKYKPKVVAITGSVGKTTTKDAIYFALSSGFHVRRSEKSFNSELGLPLTILGCQNAWTNPFLWLRNILKGFLLFILPNKFPSWLVLEIGADRPGDIESVSKWLRSDVVVYTRMPTVPVHVEFFAKIEDVVKEKSFLIESLRESGNLVINADDEKCMSFKSLRRAGRFASYGLEESADFFASNYKVLYLEQNGNLPAGITFKVNFKGNSIPINIQGVLGMQYVYPILAGVAVGVGEGLNTLNIAEGFKKFEMPRGRMNLIKGIKNSIIVDDSYNSSPVAVEEALKALGGVDTEGRKIAVLGDMLELGKHSAGSHQAIGSLIKDYCDVLVTVGIRSREIAQVALNNAMPENNIFQFDDSKSAGSFLQNMIVENDVVLVKGSQSIRCERVVAEIMAEPENKERLLVRQEKEWEKRM